MYHYSGEHGQVRWKLLCICSEQFSFQKTEVRRYYVNDSALRAGWATNGQWRRSVFLGVLTDRVRRKIEASRHAV
jgi:hypothetical protein